uniref:Sentrin-specific protease 3/5 conserved domain-containing protein n=1 Tax=Xenopus tropicalis TaxID=8364 RepID=A0A1B8XT34_XENTR
MRHAPVQRHLPPFSPHCLARAKNDKLFYTQGEKSWGEKEDEEEEEGLIRACTPPPRPRRGRRQRLPNMRSLYLRLYKRSAVLPFHWKLWGGLGGRRKRLWRKGREGGSCSAGAELDKAHGRGAEEVASLANHVAEEETGILDQFLQTYGSLIPLGTDEVVEKLEDVFQQSFSTPARRTVVQHVIQSYQRHPGNAMLRGFRVTYKRHVLSMDDLGTLYGQNWLNDQVRHRPLHTGGNKGTGGGNNSVCEGQGEGAIMERSRNEMSEAGHLGGNRVTESEAGHLGGNRVTE